MPPKLVPLRKVNVVDFQEENQDWTLMQAAKSVETWLTKAAGRAWCCSDANGVPLGGTGGFLPP